MLWINEFEGEENKCTLLHEAVSERYQRENGISSGIFPLDCWETRVPVKNVQKAVYIWNSTV